MGLDGTLVFTGKDAYHDKPLSVPCGQCIGCRLERARQWAIRCTHEASMHERSCFATFTYEDEQLPHGYNLHRKHFQDFMKRLRKRCGYVRVFYCGEYGGETHRPHYHALLFNFRPNDGKILRQKGDRNDYSSEKLNSIWGLGLTEFSDVTFTSAAYVAGYVTKKVTGDPAAKHYEYVDPDDGVIVQRTPEFSGCSNRPGIGQLWIKRWLHDVYPRDQIIINGKAMRPPRYYDKQCEILEPGLWLKTKRNRATALRDLQHEQINAPNSERNYNTSSRRLLVAEKITNSRQKLRKETNV